MRTRKHIQVQEEQRVPATMNPNRPTIRHIIIKVGKVKERILTATRIKQGSTYNVNISIFNVILEIS